MLTSVCSYMSPAWPRFSGVRSSREFIATPPQARVSLTGKQHIFKSFSTFLSHFVLAVNKKKKKWEKNVASSSLNNHYIFGQTIYTLTLSRHWQNVSSLCFHCYMVGGAITHLLRVPNLCIKSLEAAAQTSNHVRQQMHMQNNAIIKQHVDQNYLTLMNEMTIQEVV